MIQEEYKESKRESLKHRITTKRFGTEEDDIIVTTTQQKERGPRIEGHNIKFTKESDFSVQAISESEISLQLSGNRKEALIARQEKSPEREPLSPEKEPTNVTPLPVISEQEVFKQQSAQKSCCAKCCSIF